MIRPGPEYYANLRGPPVAFLTIRTTNLVGWICQNEKGKNKEDTSGQNVLQATTPSYPELPP